MLPKLVTGVVALSKYASACKDEKDWSACIDAYRNGECHNFEGCDRTCGKCFGEADCYDKIPENHSFLFGTGAPARAIWPNFSNQNSPPVVQIDVDDHFPFDRSSISQFCLDIFDNGLCDNSNNLVLTYSDSEGFDINIDLYGSAKEYCGFTCGNCKTNSEMGDCWSKHNNNMQYLSGLNAGVAGSEINLGFELGGLSDESWGNTDSSWGNSDDSWGNTESSWGNTDDSWGSSSWGGGWDLFGRKRRSTPGNMERGELLSEAIESLIFPQLKDMLPLNARNRRYVMDWMAGQQPADHDEAERIKGEMGDLRCFKSMMNDDSQVEDDGEEEEEEEASEEEFEDPYVRVRQQRKETDHDGIRNWVADNTPEGTTLAGECSDFIVPVEEAYSEMELAYFCKIQCETGTPHVQMGEELVLLDGEFQMKCSKARYHRFKEAAVCSASAYCVGTACNQVVCIAAPETEVDEPAYAPESEGEIEDAWGNEWDFMY
jgi:hypothetical protein